MPLLLYLFFAMKMGMDEISGSIQKNIGDRSCSYPLKEIFVIP
jgi:hypothetical protein